MHMSFTNGSSLKYSSTSSIYFFACVDVQVAVDLATVERMWRFMRDAHFVDASTQALQFQVAVLNSEARDVAFWSMRVTMMPSGRFQAHASVGSAPVTSFRSFWNLRDFLSSATHVLMFMLGVAHTAFVSGLLSARPSAELPAQKHAGMPGAPAAGEITAPFRSLCQVVFLGSIVSLLTTLFLNEAMLIQVKHFSLVQGPGLPTAQFIPVNMYHDLLAPARMLLPAKNGGQGAPGGLCDVVGDGIAAPLDIRSEQNNTPLWARETDDCGALESFSLLLVLLRFSFLMHLFLQLW